jgi:small nuclear ribonucleoprotein (snRNP)-like protein
MTSFVNPTPFLAELAGSAVVVRLKVSFFLFFRFVSHCCGLKWGMEYKGVLKSTDKHMNLQVMGKESFREQEEAKKRKKRKKKVIEKMRAV